MNGVHFTFSNILNSLHQLIAILATANIQL